LYRRFMRLLRVIRFQAAFNVAAPSLIADLPVVLAATRSVPPAVTPLLASFLAVRGPSILPAPPPADMPVLVLPAHAPVLERLVRAVLERVQVEHVLEALRRLAKRPVRSAPQPEAVAVVRSIPRPRKVR